MNGLRRWLRHAAPSPLAGALSSAAAGLLMLGFLVSLGYGLSSGLDDFVENAGFLFGVIVSPFIALLLAVAGVVEKNPLPRGLIWAGAGGALLVGGLGMAAGLSASPSTGLAGGLVTYCVVCSPLAALCFLPAVYFVSKAGPSVRRSLAQTDDQQIIEAVTLRGEAALADLARATGLPMPAVAHTVERLLHTGRLAGQFDAAAGRVYSQQALVEKQRRLGAVIAARGQITFDALAAEMNVSRHLLRDWIYQLVRRGGFTGYMNWADGVIYSAEARRLEAAGRCPRCGGELSLAGRGVIRCDHCGSEIFL